jgi:hypothetical protein
VPSDIISGRAGTAGSGTGTLAVWWLPALVCLVSILSANAAYLISLGHGQVAACVPYLEGCSSISRAARNEPAIHLFRATMIPVAVILAAVWWLAGQWLAQAGDRSRPVRHTIVALGVIGAVFLVLYATFLGTHGPVYDLMRRYGVIIFFAFTMLGQMIVTARLQSLRRQARPATGAGVERSMLLLAGTLLGLGLANIPASHFFDAPGLGNAIEWTFALLMMAWFGLLSQAWKRSRFAVRSASLAPPRKKPEPGS